MVQFTFGSLLRGPAFIAMFITAGFCSQAQQPVWKSDAYTLYADSVVQQKYKATALSRHEIVSNYQSPANEFKSSAISFKFSINGKDNEMLSGNDHHFNISTTNLHSEAPLIRFGKQLKPVKGGKPGFLKTGSTLKLRLDMREVLGAFKTKGYYTAFDGSKIYKEDFKGVYVAGSSAPLIWDFDNLVHHSELELKDADGDGIYEILLRMNVAEEEKKTLSHWKQSRDIDAFPRTESPYLLPDALYNMALEEMINAVEPDSTLRTGKEWAGVWTRDVSYSIILSMAHLQPQAARYSLLRKVDKKKKIIQDTGTGGAWPVSTDRLVWAVAAWELYKVNGDRRWLAEAYEVIKNSLEADRQVAYDPVTGLVKGESSFLDWREQTYPRWMQPADIFESMNLGTNAVHYQANKVAASMASLLGRTDDSMLFEATATKIKKAINDHFWLKDRNNYAQYIYGRVNKFTSPRSEALGAALCVLFGIADQQQAVRMVESMPLTPYGISCIFPQIPEIPPYHNNGIWPFVQSYWLWAGAVAGNETSVMESIAAIYRPAALFATNKENFVSENGDYAGTQINSSNMLWSLAGNISIVHRLFFGIQFEEEKLVFKPFVPEALKGIRKLDNFRYRNAILNITVEGFGDAIESFEVDGVSKNEFEFPATASGTHEVKIRLKRSGTQSFTVNHQPVVFTPAAPDVVGKGKQLSWRAVPGADKYRVIINGKTVKEISGMAYTVTGSAFMECQVIAIGRNGLESFASEPVTVNSSEQVYEMENTVAQAAYPYKGFSGKGFVETSTTVNTNITIPVHIEKAGRYLIDLRYANGNGPVNTDNKCAVRAVVIDGKNAGTLVFPHRGKGEWSDWGWSNLVIVDLSAGKHNIGIEYQPANENMNIEVNQAMLDKLRLRKLE